MTNTLLVYVMIKAIDQASMILAKLGINGLKGINPLLVGAAAVAGGLAAIGVESLKLANQFDYNMQKIAALTSAGPKDMEAYKSALLAMAPAVDQAPVALAKGLYFVISAGFKGQAALDVLRYSAKAAAATMGDMGQISDMVTSALNAYAGEGLTAGQVTDDLVTAMVQGKANMHAFQTSFSFLAITARAGGFSIGEAAAAMSALSRVAGDTASRRMTMGLDNLIRSLGNIKHIAKTMAANHLGFDEKAYAAKNLGDKILYIAHVSGMSTKTLADLKKQAGGNEAKFEDLALQLVKNNQLFKDLAGGAAAFIPAAILAGDQGVAYNSILKEMTGHGERTARAFDIMRESSTQMTKMIENGFASIFTLIGEAIEPAWKGFLALVYKATSGALGFLSVAKNMDAVKYAMLGMALVATTILLPSIIGVVVASAPVWGPIALAILAVVAAGTVLGLIIKAVIAHFGGMAGVMRALHPIITLVQGALKRAGDELHKAFANPQVQMALRQLQAALPGLIPLLEVIGAIVGAIIVVSFQIFVGILNGLLTALPPIIQLFTGVVNILGGIGRLIKDIFTGNFKDIVPALKQIGMGVLQVLSGALGAVILFVYGFIEHFVQLFGTSDHKIKLKLIAVGKSIATTVGGWFSALGTKVHDGIAAVGQKFSDLGTMVHGLLMAAGKRIWDAITWPFRKLVEIGRYLYEHSYRIQHATDNVYHFFLKLRDGLINLLKMIVRGYEKEWDEIVSAAKWIAGMLYRYVVEPWLKIWAQVTQWLGKLRDWLGQQWDKIATKARQLWDGLVSFISSIGTKVGTAVHDHVVKPIQDKWNALLKDAAGWGGKLMDMIAKDIEKGKDKLGAAAQKALQGIKDWLGWHSPAPKVPDSAYWGANLIKMVSRSMLSQMPALSAAAAHLSQTIGAGLTQPVGGPAIGGAASGAPAAGRAFAGAVIGRAGGQTTITHNWNVTFPGVKNKDEIKKALTELQQDDYRKARRAGSYGGLRAGIDTLT